MILADKIAQLRRQNGWSQEELAGRLNVSRQAVSKWEGGASIPDLDKILKMSALFNVTTDYLLKDELECPELEPAAAMAEVDDLEPLRTVSLEEANRYLETVRSLCGRMAGGVSLCVLSPIALLLLGVWADGTPREDFAGGLGVIVLLVLVALGLLLIIPAGLQLEEYEYLEKEDFCLGYGVAGVVQQQKEAYAPEFRRRITQGVVLCVLSVVPLMGVAMLGGSDFAAVAAVGLLLAIVAAAMPLLVSTGMVQGSFERLLQSGDYTVHNKRLNRRVSWFAGAYWCVVTAVYLGVNFVQDSWKTSWIIWAVAGLLFAALYGAVRAFAEKRK